MNTETEQTETEEEKLERELKEKQRELLEIQLRNAKAEEEERTLKKNKQETLRQERGDKGWLIKWGIIWFFGLLVLTPLVGPLVLVIAGFLIWWAIKRMTQGE